MKIRGLKYLCACLLISGGCSASAMGDIEYTGMAAFEQRYFTQDALYPEQSRINASIYFSPELYTAFNDGDDTVLFKGFYRLDQDDSERTHGDIREFLWSHIGGDWEIKTGIGKVFWGQTESLHLVDIINQTDAVEAIDGEDKLGQPMVALSLYKDWGNFTLFALPYFRERTFAGVEGRLRLPLVVETDDALYESSHKEKNLDWAVRWQRSAGNWELGLSYFDGTSREPEFISGLNNKDEVVLRPYYPQIQQVGADILGIIDDWIVKLEVIQRSGYNQDYWAMVGGFEYTSYQVLDSVYDIGWLIEYQYDDRQELATSPAQNDLFLGARFVFNDIDGTEILMGVVQDLDYSNVRSGLVEASRRINDQWKWRLDSYLFSSDEPEDTTYLIRKDDYLQFSLEYYF